MWHALFIERGDILSMLETSCHGWGIMAESSRSVVKWGADTRVGGLRQ